MTLEFRCAFFAKDYEATLLFYRDGLELPVVGGWDRGLDDRGTLFGAASGIIEVMSVAHDREFDPPRSVTMVMEVDDVDVWYKRAQDKGLPIKGELADRPWGHRSFQLTDPNGVSMSVFSKIEVPRA